MDSTMWVLAWIIGILIIFTVWGIWFFFPPEEPGGSEIVPMWLAIAVTVVILGGLITFWIIRRIRAARAARVIEKQLREAAEEQEQKAKPEDREEVKALNRQFLEGIAQLKASKLSGGMRGDQALYALPWYAIVGPPGAGKTTALKHSGLQFPFLDPQSGGGVRGVGGTRNCDWWFTNEAILLDTAGRYTTEVDDRDEWEAFLEQLLKNRPEKPLNGIIVAVSVNELLDATEDQIRQLASKVRARVDEMQVTLKTRMPTYVLFTKTDLVAGFTEFFGDFKKSERGRAWGATIPLDEPRTEPARIFDREFDILVEALHERVTKRMINERSRAAKERIYQFPLEFAAIKKPLSDFVQEAFAPSASGPQPLLRGFYFTSGTQEGKPLDRVVGAMGRAFGLKGSVAEEAEAAKEPKSYFLKDVFQTVIFPDQKLASLSEAEVRKRMLQKLAIGAAALALALLFMGPGIYSYLNNRDLVKQSERISSAAAEVKWTEGGSSVQKVQKLDDLRSQIEMLKDWKENGKPITYSWFMYQGDTLLDALVKQYHASLQEGFMKPSKDRLEDKLEAVQGKEYLKDYNNLKTYLLIGEPKRLADPELEKWEAARLTQVWAEVLLPQSELPEADLKARLFPHVQLYTRLLRDGQIQPEPRETRLVEAARERLRTADQSRAYYELFVISKIDEKIDETGLDSYDNLKYPPISLQIVFGDRPELIGKLGVLDSKKNLAEGKYYEVRGPYTKDAFKVIDKNLSEEGIKLLEREAWVVPYDGDEKKQKERVEVALKRVRRQYEDDYISEWESFFYDIDVKIPQTNAEAIKEYKLLATPDWAYKRLLQALSDNTQFEEQKVKGPAALTADGGVISQIETRVKRRFEQGSGVRVEELKAMKDMSSQERLTRHFKSLAVFGVEQPYVPPLTPPEGQPPPPKLPPDPELNKYIGHLELLAAEMQVVEEGPPNTETKNATELFTKAVKETEQMLRKLDKNGQPIMEPLLMNPLRQGYKAFVKGAGGAASGLWEVMVWPHYRDKIKDRYPFNVAAKRDASYEDAVAFFRPKDGILWGFYDKYLHNFHVKQGHDYIPLAYLQGAVPQGKPFTPFKSAMYPCLKRASEITDAIWPDFKGEEPNVVFQINLKTVSPIVSDVVFEVDGQTRNYRNEKEFWYEFKWPGEERRGARLQVRGAGGLDEEIVRDGPWGIFRLFESADKITAVKDDDKMFLVTWTMSAPPVSVTMQVKPRRGNHPFALSFFRATNCPPSIGDKFGGQKDGGGGGGADDAKTAP
jgi:type VI secretion system protein ImpL